MQRPGWNPVRRNRNIGTAKQGHGQDNRLVIPSDWRDTRAFWERLTRFRVAKRPIHGREMPFVVETTRQDCVYACTVEDVVRLLQAASAEHVFGIKGVILRQPKRKEQILSPVWGRLGYAVEVGPINGPAIIVEACPVPLTSRWPTKLRAADQEELERLLGEADRIERDGRHHLLHFGLNGVRRVQLYRTILHELGHWADWYEKVEVPARSHGNDWFRLRDAYWTRPRCERESFAHRYASGLAQRLRTQGIIPFERIMAPRVWAAEGLSLSDFVPALELE
jgi:hypothetical protein